MKGIADNYCRCHAPPVHDCLRVPDILLRIAGFFLQNQVVLRNALRDAVNHRRVGIGLIVPRGIAASQNDFAGIAFCVQINAVIEPFPENR